jgi:RNA polymerase sigma factor (sigma-70 family)
VFADTAVINAINPQNPVFMEEASDKISGLKSDNSMVSMSEYLLWKKFREGNLDAYAVIYRKYFFTLLKYGKKITHDNEMIKDCIQDLFIKIWNNRENLRDTTSIKYYLFTSLKRKLLDTFETPHIKFATDKEILDDDLIEVTNYSEEETLPSNWRNISNALNKLSLHQQKLLKLKYSENLSNKEIADQLGITIQSVYNAVFKALKSLRKQLVVILMLATNFLSH